MEIKLDIRLSEGMSKGIYSAKIEDKDLILFKIGTSAIERKGSINSGFLEVLAQTIFRYRHNSRARFAIVSSGAVYSGMLELGLGGKPHNMTKKQVLSGIGNSCLIEKFYKPIFGKYHLGVMPALVTHAQLNSEHEMRNLVNIVHECHDGFVRPIIPVFNENDVVSNEELQGIYAKRARKSGKKEYFTIGDNDMLAGHIGAMINADLVVFVTDVPGILTEYPVSKASELIHTVHGKASYKAGKSDSEKCRKGGIDSKHDSAVILAKKGIPSIITDVHEFKDSDSFSRILSADIPRTLVLPKGYR